MMIGFKGAHCPKAVIIQAVFFCLRYGVPYRDLEEILSGWFWLIEVLQVKYINNIIEQDHRFIKKLTRQMKGFKSFKSASATLEGIEVAHMIRKQQFETSGQSAFKQFTALVG